MTEPPLLNLRFPGDGTVEVTGYMPRHEVAHFLREVADRLEEMPPRLSLVPEE